MAMRCMRRDKKLDKGRVDRHLPKAVGRMEAGTDGSLPMANTLAGVQPQSLPFVPRLTATPGLVVHMIGNNRLAIDRESRS